MAMGMMAVFSVPTAQASDTPVPQIKPSLPQLPPLNLAGIFSVYWSGLHVGDLILGVEEEDGRYLVRTAIESRGLARLISNYYSISYSQGRIGPSHYHPEKFQSRFNLRGRSKRITLAYDVQGRQTKRHYDPLENRQKRPDVEQEQRDHTFDPLTTGLQVRRAAADIASNGGDSFVMPVYDGRRRTDLIFTYEGLVTISSRNARNPKRRKREALHFTLRRTPLAGFTENEWKRMEETDPVIDLYLDPDDMIPLKAVGTAALGTAVGHLKQLCADFDSCMAQYAP